MKKSQGLKKTVTRFVRYFFAMCVLLFCLGCPDEDIFNPDAEIRIVNNSEIDVIELRRYTFSDTTLPIGNPLNERVYVDYATIHRGSSITIPEEREIVDKYGMMLFLLSRDTFLNTSWERIRDSNLVLKRYELTLHTLDTMHWTLEYP